MYTDNDASGSISLPLLNCGRQGELKSPVTREKGLRL